MALLIGMLWYLIVVSVCISLMIYGMDLLLICLLISHLCMFFGQVSIKVLSLFFFNSVVYFLTV